MTAIVFLAAIAFEIIGGLACMLGAVALLLITTHDVAELHAWCPEMRGLDKRAMALGAFDVAAGGLVLFLTGLYWTTRIIAA